MFADLIHTLASGFHVGVRRTNLLDFFIGQTKAPQVIHPLPQTHLGSVPGIRPLPLALAHLALIVGKALAGPCARPAVLIQAALATAQP